MVLASLLVGACSDVTRTPTRQSSRLRPGSAASSATSGDHIPMLDDLLEQVNLVAPGFAGLHWSSPGVLVIHTTPEASTALVQQAVRIIFKDLAWDRVKSVVFRSAKFDVLTLQNWRARVTEIVGPNEFIWSDFDETSDVVRVGVAESADLADLALRAAALGAPAGAVVFEHSKPIVPLAYLSAQHRPTVGGLLISLYDTVITRKYGAGEYAQCSIGANVRLSTDQSNEYFLTAAHCSNEDNIFTSDGATVFQPDSATNSTAIGVEVSVPGARTGLSGCPTGYTCKYSDAALYQYNSASYSNFAYIARDSSFTSTWGVNGSRFRVDSFHVVSDIPEAYLLAADTVNYDTWMHKVASTTGWTWGQLKHTCMTIAYSGSKALLCQYGAAAYADHGDSGGPMFWWMCCNPNEAWLGGILHTVSSIPDWHTIFSSITGIKNDIANLVTY